LASARAAASATCRLPLMLMSSPRVLIPWRHYPFCVTITNAPAAFLLRPLERWCRGAAAGFLAARGRLLVPRRQLGAVLGHLPLKAFFGAGFKLGARLGKFRQTLFSTRQFLRDRHAIRHISLIRGFCPRQQFGHFGLQLGLDLARMFIGQRAVPAHINEMILGAARKGARIFIIDPRGVDILDQAPRPVGDVIGLMQYLQESVIGASRRPFLSNFTTDRVELTKINRFFSPGL
jgi:hypothetical protein